MSDLIAMQSERTILFADVAGSTRIIETLGDKEGLKCIGGVIVALSEVVREGGGVVIKTIGDAVMASFEQPGQAVSAAVQMQHNITQGGSYSGVRARVKIGLHSGPVILEGGDVYGDVVNVAARVVDFAKADQILATDDVASSIRSIVQVRTLGDHSVRGRDRAVSLVELIWDVEVPGLTQVMPPMDRVDGARDLTITFGISALTVSGREPSAHSIGRDSESGLAVPDDAASRSHATISVRAGRFYLSDHSTNGTNVAPRDREPIFVHRDEVLLQGEGTIRLGRDVSDPEGEVLEYRVGPGD